MDFSNVKSVYFIGIGGIGMSATAGIAREAGLEVFGSDSKEIYAPSKDVLDNFDIPYVIGYNADNISSHPSDVYIISSGEGEHNPEVDYILKHELPYASFPELLYFLAKDDLRVVVTGTHGKSTTTALLGHLLKELDDSSFMSGAVLLNYETNFHHGSGHYFVFEGDEYKSLFNDPTPKAHYYKPDILVLTNLEFDHPDVFANLDDLKQEFQALIENMPDDGLIIYNADDANLSSLMHMTNIANFSFGIHNQADYIAKDIVYGEAFTDFSLYDKDGLKAETYQTKLAGEINVYNALAAVATLRALGFKPEQFQDALKHYEGIKRRFQVIGKKNGITVIDDYAHHPTAVRETLEAARSRYKDKRIWAVFEPHTFSRTEATLPDLAKSFNEADEVLLAPIYAAREQVKNANITSEQAVEKIKVHQPNIRLVEDKNIALHVLKNEVKPGDTVIVMAVGSFNRLGYELLSEL